MYIVSMFQCFNNVVKNVTLNEVIDSIKGGIYQKQIEQLRTLEIEGRKNEFENRKKSLPAFTPSGVFEGGRKPELLKQYSQCIVLDIDHLEASTLSEVKQQAIKDNHTLACFVSPSGKGLKIIVLVDSQMHDHKRAFELVKTAFEEKLHIKVDSSGKDITRLCFISFDAAAFFNPNPAIFHIKAPVNVKSTFSDVKSSTHIFESCVKFTQQKEPYYTGNRNNFIFQLACNLNRHGISYTEALNLILSRFDYNKKEITSTVKSAFNHVIEHGQAIYRKTNSSESTHPESKKEAKGSDEKITSNKFHLAIQFLKSNFDIRRNIVNMEYEYRETGKTAFQSMNEFNIFVKMQTSGLSISFNHLVAILRSDYIASYNPFLQYFEALPSWDRKTDHISYLAQFVKARDRQRFDGHFTKWLVRVVACALDDTFFNKQAFILVQEKQNSGKSTFCRFLCPPLLSGYIAENISVDKDSRVLLTRNLLVNLDELSTLSKVEVNALKSLFSKEKINERLPYDRNNSIIPRRCSFIGSTNQAEFLNDESGSVRWLCFVIDEIDWSYKQKVNIDQVYAQAYHLYKSGFDYNLTPDEIKENEECNKQFQINTSEKELICKYLSPAFKERHDKFMTATDILLYLAQVTDSRIKLNSINIGRALKMCGFIRIKHPLDRVYGYYVFL